MSKPTVLPDDLGKLVIEASARLSTASTWENFVHSSRSTSDLAPTVRDLHHPASHLLDRLRKVGAPVITGTLPWTQDRKRAALRRGPHASAKKHTQFLRQEFADMIQKGHWTVLPASQVMHLRNVRLSPLGVVPQRDRRPRTICDYTFYQVNDDTSPLAPLEAMQFGRTLHRLLRHIIRANPRFGPVYLSKLDIADGFYRIWLLPNDVPKLGVLFPQCDGEDQLVGFPLALPMGWIHSPPYFTAVTETVTDLANAATCTHTVAAPHRLDFLANTPQPLVPVAQNEPCQPKPTTTAVPHRIPRNVYSRPLATHDVYVDDFISLAQGNKRRLRTVRRILLHTMDQVFRPLDASDSPFRQEPVSLNKLSKGDANWTTRKMVLGWIIDTARSTLELPPHKLDRLNELLASVPTTCKRISAKRWHKLLGELRSMLLAFPGGRGLFSTLQDAFRHHTLDGRLKLSAAVHDFLNDFRWLAKDLGARPTRIAELTPLPESTLGACDASGSGMGGVHFVPTPCGTQLQPYLWRAPFPPHIVNALVSYTNPLGTITNSDLELAGTIAHHDVLAHQADIRELTIHNLHDNTPAMFWQRKGSTTTTKAAAYLLRLQSLHQRFHRYVPLHDYIPGPANVMADTCSRAWHLSDAALLTFFNFHFPQRLSWKICLVQLPMLSALTFALSSIRSAPASFLRVPKHPTTIGPAGHSFAPTITWTPSSAMLATRSHSSRSGGPATVTAEPPPAVSPSGLAQWKTPCVPWARRLPAWGPKTLAKTVWATSISASNGSFAPTAKLTRPPRV